MSSAEVSDSESLLDIDISQYEVVEKYLEDEELESFDIYPSGWTICKDILHDSFHRLLYFYVPFNSKYYYIWSFFVSFGVMYNMFAMVIFIFADIKTQYFWNWIFLNVMFDMVFIVDIFVQSRLTYLHEGEEVKNTKKLRKNYFFQKLKVANDIFCLLPLDFLLFFDDSMSLVRTIRIVKVIRLMDFVQRTQQQTTFPRAFKIILLAVSCIVLFHWNACLYFLFSLYEGITEESQTEFGFSYYKVFEPVFPTCQAYYDENCWFGEDIDHTLDLDDVRDSYKKEMAEYWKDKHYRWTTGNFSREYSMSIYWSALTITTCGQQPWPSTSSQNSLEVFDTLIGVLVFATIIGSVGSVVTQMSQTVNEFRQMMDGIKFYMKYREVNSAIQERALSCFMYLMAHNQLDDEEGILSLLPPRLQANIAANLHMETLQNIQIFALCESRFMHEVVLLVKQQVFSPNDYLCRKNEKAKELFIVKKGKLRVIDDDTGEEMGELTEGATFGELSIVYVKGNLLGTRRCCSLQSVGFSDIYVLYRDDVSRLLQEFPQEYKTIVMNARNLLHSRGLLETTELGEMCDPSDHEEADDLVLEEMSVVEQLNRLNGIIDGLNGNMNVMILSFSNSCSYYKQKITGLEDTFNQNREQIRSDFKNGLYIDFIDY
ncbi:Cyclic nucleotide-binding domain-containing protein [Caenorhabditis elegans]|uniref:Cyclic nucleotide-binding domain-containing protein n=1 Tax=Caenorhabditis elegans TaxID=6239 RepID=O61827_CAEEL|nr:Cyclic nucleotide-binding domain-containing protein [Caenorhabditis elegans]CCD65345.3 Cyclic nucleotide-binding domain-containing protein [Caenorhabditis elegans]|eukprot:NP_001343628.1 Uncharacterized protein CELE_C23H5.7 [Caenorhabditis elegans]